MLFEVPVFFSITLVLLVELEEPAVGDVAVDRINHPLKQQAQLSDYWHINSQIYLTPLSY